ncbi:telomeric repeat-binding factor 1 [Polymixia lowei]
MEPETSNKTVSTTSISYENVNFAQVTAVGRGWIFDFAFVSLCRYFREGEAKLDEFSDTLSTLQAIVQGLSLTTEQTLKLKIASFLARVMHGKKLDVLFEEDDHVMPLMSAASIWSTLRDTVADESLFESITTLLFVQSVAVCLQNGERSKASSALKWLEEKPDVPRNLLVKMSTIVKRKNTYHPFILNFNFVRLLDTVQSYLDAFLEENPSDFLLQAATKVVQSSQHKELKGDSVAQDETLSEIADKSTEDRAEIKEIIKSFRTKRKLLSTRQTELWKPDSCKKPHVSLVRIADKKRISQGEGTRLTQTRKRQKWTPSLDKSLEEGVKCHGEGKWSLILLDYDFEGRTGTMLKDRWRVLKKTHKVG